jgi:uncharacterized lipoprotein YddW (UPF0748 family)
LWAHAGRDATSRADIDDLVTKIDAARFNAVLLLVYASGTAYFEPSHTRFSDDERLSNQSEFEDDDYSDALSYLLSIRDQRRADQDLTNDFEVHAWFTVTQNGAYRRDSGWPRENTTRPYMLHYLYPEFKLKYGCYYTDDDENCLNHRYSSVHQPRFRAYMADLIAGLVEDYEVEGVHLDYIRAMEICYNDEPLDYPGDKYDYPGCQEDYKAWTRATYGQEYTLWDDTDGRNEIEDGGSGRVAAWQERAVNMLVQEIHTAVKTARPEAMVTAAVGLTSPEPEERETSIQGQAAWEWLDKGWLDAAFVMVYSKDTQAIINKTQSFMDAVQNPESRSKIFPGLITYSLDNPADEWSYLIEEQVLAVTGGPWTGQPLAPPAQGIALFVDRRLSQKAIDLLAAGSFKEPALPAWYSIVPVNSAEAQ